MNHDEAILLLGPYRDGELDLTTCLQVEAHLASCSSCREKLADLEDLNDFIQERAVRFKAPDFLKTRIQAALRQEQKLSGSTTPWWKRLSLPWAYTGLIGAAAALALFAIFSMQERPGVAEEAVANHVRSLQASHLMDVASTDQHTVKPWFAGKLDYSPQVIDLTSAGYPLIGGRLDVLDHRTVAAIVYQRRKHFINLFIWPAEKGGMPGRLYNENGYHALGWTKAGMNYLAVSELGEKELREFVAMIQEQTMDSHPE